MKCIICKEEREPSVEHVFPESIGGSYEIRTVCKDCNDKLGREVDCKLTDHLYVKIVRNNLRLMGKKSRMPSSFQTGNLVGDTLENEQIKISLSYDECSGGLCGQVVPKRIEFVSKDGGSHVYKCVADSDSPKDFVSMIQGLCRKHGGPQPSSQQIKDLLKDLKNSSHDCYLEIRIADDIFLRCRLVKADPNLVECFALVDTVHYKRAVAKIIYELACEWLGSSYLQDPCGEKLLRFVLDPSLVSPPEENIVRGKICIVNEPSIDDPIDPQECKHSAKLCLQEDVLVLDVSIFNVFRGAIIVSETPSLYHPFHVKRIELDPLQGSFVCQGC